jgi:hypothetical protein
MFYACCWALCLASGVAGLHQEATVAPFGLAPVYAVSALFWVLCVPFWLRAGGSCRGAARPH